MKPERLPKGKTEDEIRELIKHYDSQSEEDALREDEEYFGGQTAKKVTAEEARQYLYTATQMAARAAEKLSDEDVLKLYEECKEMETDQEAG